MLFFSMFNCANCHVPQQPNFRPLTIIFYREVSEIQRDQRGYIKRGFDGEPILRVRKEIQKELKVCQTCHDGHSKGIPLPLLAKQAAERLLASKAKDRLLKRAAEHAKPKPLDLTHVPIMGVSVQVETPKQCPTPPAKVERILHPRDGRYPAKKRKREKNESVEKSRTGVGKPVRHKAETPKRVKPRHKCR